MILTERTYTQEEINRIKAIGDVTPNGVAFDSELVGPQGAAFTIISEGQEMETLRLAERWLWAQHDVVGVVKLAHKV